MRFPKNDQVKLCRLYEGVSTKGEYEMPEPMYASGKIEDIINNLKYWEEELKDGDEGQLQEFSEWLQEAELTVNNPNRRKRFFDEINKATESQNYILAYLIPNFGELDGSAWKYYTVRYPDGQKFKIKLVSYEPEEDSFGDMPEKKGNKCKIEDIIESIDDRLNPPWGWHAKASEKLQGPGPWNNAHGDRNPPLDKETETYWNKILEIAKRSISNPNLRKEIIDFIEDDPSLLPNFGEVDGVYNVYLITYPDGKKYKISL